MPCNWVRLGNSHWLTGKVHVRKVRDVSQDVQRGRDSKSERSGDLKRSHWILDVIEHIIHVLPSIIGEEDLKHRGCILGECQWVIQTEEREVQTSLLLFELPTNASRKFKCGSLTRVLPERTTQPRSYVILQMSVVTKRRCLTSDHDKYEDDCFEERQYLGIFVSIC
jgi:hypothetical protein